MEGVFWAWSLQRGLHDALEERTGLPVIGEHVTLVGVVEDRLAHDEGPAWQVVTHGNTGMVGEVPGKP